MERGERVPDFVLPVAPDGALLRFYGHVGGAPAAIVLCDAQPRDRASAIRTLADASIPVFVIGEPAAHAGAIVFPDADGTMRGRLRHGPEDGDRVLVLDARVRVSATLPLSPIDAVVAAVREVAAPARQAPVLLVPNVLDASTCARLLDRFEKDGHVETGVEKTTEGKRVDALQPSAKRRRDHTVSDASLLGDLTKTVGRRVIPEVQHAFAFRATRFEGFKIARYDAESRGHFAPHRDNLSPNTAHRRFAMSLNLNDDYEGGELRFPEFGPTLYKPATGEALLFSGSLLHEALPVTRGHRFVLLSFLFAE